MLRRTVSSFSLNKGPQQPGPTLQGFGRTTQKRRLEYETVESKYHKREFNKNWDLAGATTRSSDYLEVRTYFNYGNRIGAWLCNLGATLTMSLIPGAGVLCAMHEANKMYDESIHRAAWW
jgi:hypothetical protein